MPLKGSGVRVLGAGSKRSPTSSSSSSSRAPSPRPSSTPCRSAFPPFALRPPAEIKCHAPALPVLAVLRAHLPAFDLARAPVGTRSEHGRHSVGTHGTNTVCSSRFSALIDLFTPTTYIMVVSSEPSFRPAAIHLNIQVRPPPSSSLSLIHISEPTRPRLI
eukprot:3743853-Rhodomonas_salina.1